jgi:predicted transcriptional regulator
MDFFDERVLAAFKDGKTRSFPTLLSEVGFSHNTLQQHLERLVSQGFVVKDKMTSNSLGRPKFAYHVPSKTTKQVTVALQDPYETLVALPFSCLRHLCRFEKGGYCKEVRKSCGPQNYPQTRK